MIHYVESNEEVELRGRSYCTVVDALVNVGIDTLRSDTACDTMVLYGLILLYLRGSTQTF